MDSETQALIERIKALEAEVSRLRELEAIRDLLTRYSRALDFLDEEMLEDVFFDDGEIDYGFFKGSGKDFKPVVLDIERNTPRRFHFGAQAKILLDGNTAEVHSYGIAAGGQRIAAEAGDELNCFMGYYFDRLEKRNGRWGIARRKYVLLSGSALKESVMEGPLGALNLIGAATPEHPDFGKLGD